MKELSRIVLHFMKTKADFKNLPLQVLRELLVQARRSFGRLLETQGLLTGVIGRQRARTWADRIEAQLPESALECSATQQLTMVYGFEPACDHL